jgi:hypothetical protein
MRYIVRDCILIQRHFIAVFAILRKIQLELAYCTSTYTASFGFNTIKAKNADNGIAWERPTYFQIQQQLLWDGKESKNR